MIRLTATVLILFTCLLSMPRCAAQVWTVIGFDPKDDGRNPATADAAQLSYRYDKTRDLLWFRFSLYGHVDANAFSVNIAIDTGADDSQKMNWWGDNKDFKFDKLVTAWVTPVDRTIGVADAAGVKQKQFTNLLRNNLEIRIEGDSILLGIKRTDITDKMTMTLIGEVGVWNDDIPNRGSLPLDLAAPRSSRGLREIDTNRNNFRLPPESQTLPDDRLASVSKRGNGPEPLILIPGVYSGNQPFASFLARNSSKFRAFVLTPPGLGSTPPRSLPSEAVSYGEFPWTSRLARDIVTLIRGEKLQKPVIITHGFPGSLAAEEVATKYPELIGGIVEVASIPVQFFPSSKDPTRKTPASPEERIEAVNEGWAKKWFKYVTPETWESNNYPASMFLNDPVQAETRRREAESVPLQIKIRYLCEFMASDHTKELATLTVPVLALVPSFNKEVLADPVNGFYKSFFQDPWPQFSKNPNIRIVTVPDSRVLILDDQPKLADEAISEFVEGLRSRRGPSSGN